MIPVRLPLAIRACLAHTKQYGQDIKADRNSWPCPQAGGDLRPRLLQGAGEGGLLDPGAIEAPQGIRGGAGLRGGAGICGRGNRQADRPRRLRRDGRLSQGASRRSRDAGREDRPALPQPQGLGDGGRTGRGDALPEGRRGAVARVALLGKVHARHQGADGEELHRQPVRGSAQGHAGEGRAGHLADQDARSAIATSPGRTARRSSPPIPQSRR